MEEESNNTEVSMEDFEVKPSNVTETEKLTGTRLFHRQFTDEESQQMNADKSVKLPALNGKKKAMPLSQVKPEDFTFDGLFTSKMGHKSRSMTHAHGLIKTPFLFTTLPPKNFGEGTDKENWGFTSTFIGVDDQWKKGDEIPEQSNNEEGIERHNAFYNTKVMDDYFKKELFNHSVEVFGRQIPVDILERKYSPISCLNSDEYEGKRFNPSIKGSIKDSKIPVYRLDRVGDPLPDKPNSSLIEFSKKRGKFFVSYGIEICRQKYSKKGGMINYEIKCHSMAYIECGRSQTNFSDYTL